MFISNINKEKQENDMRTVKEKVKEEITHNINVEDFKKNYGDLCIYDDGTKI
jgi:hypothetical protein